MESVEINVQTANTSDIGEELKTTVDTFVPEDIDVYISVGDKYERMIFGFPLEFREFELEQIETFNDYLIENKLRLPQGFDFREQYRFLMTSNNKYKDAYEAIVEYNRFISEHTPVNMDGLDEYLQSGILYFYKRDKRFHPICIIDVKKMVDANIDDDVLLRLALVVMGHAVEHAMRPGYIENWLVIIDFKDVSITQIPTAKLTTIVSQLKQNFRCRLFRLFGINVSIILRTIWYFAKAMCDNYTQVKMILNGSEFKQDLIEYINEDCLEAKFGGKLANKTDSFYPPEFD